MPIEIRELVIKAAVAAGSSDKDKGQSSGGKKDAVGDAVQESLEQMNMIQIQEKER